MAEAQYVLIEDFPKRLVEDAIANARERFVWLVEGGHFAGLTETLHVGSLDYQRSSQSSLVAHVRRRHLQVDRVAGEGGAFSGVVTVAEQTRHEALGESKGAAWRRTAFACKTANDVVSLAQLLEDSDDGVRPFPLICVSDVSFLLKSEDDQSPVLRLIRAMHNDGFSIVPPLRIIVGFSPRYGWISDTEDLWYRLGSVRPTRHYVLVSSSAKLALADHAKMKGAVAALTPEAKQHLGSLTPTIGRRFTAKEHELVVQGVLTSEACPDSRPETVYLPEAIATQTIVSARRELSRPLADEILSRATIGCYVDLDNCGGNNAEAWVKGIVAAIRTLCGTSFSESDAICERVKCWFVLVANWKTARGRVPAEFLKQLEQESMRQFVFREEDLDQVELRVVPAGKEAADEALARLLHWDGATTHRVVATKDRKLMANIRWSRTLCNGSLVLVTSREMREYVTQDLGVRDSEVVWVDVE